MIPMTIITWTPRDYLIDGVASGMLGAVVVAAVGVTLGRWLTRHVRMQKAV